MPTNIQNVSFVNPLDPGGAAAMAVQQQQIQRQQAIAQALQQQSMEDSKVDPGGHVSWTQGLARMAQALAANKIRNDTGKQSVDLATRQGQAMQRMFGIGQQAPAPQTPTDNVSNVPDRGMYGSGGVEDGGNLPAAPQTAPQPQAPPVAPQQPQRGPMSLSGNPMQDYVDYSSNPEEYTKQLIASHAPVDLAKTVAQARAAMDRGDTATAQALLANVEKQNNIPLVSGRPGAPMYDHSGNVVAMSPQNIEAANPVIQDGKFTGGYSLAPGATDAIHAASAAKATGNAAGELAPTYDPATGNYGSAPKLNVIARGGSITAPGPGAAAGAKSDAELGAQAFKSDADAAANSNIIRGQINNIRSISANTPTGEGAAGLASFKSHVNTIIQGMGAKPWFDQNGIAQVEEIHKDAAALAQQQASALGGASGATDAKLSAAYASLPDVDKQPQTIQMITRILGARQDMVDARKNAATAWASTHGATQSSHNEFNKQFVNAADSDLFERMAAGKERGIPIDVSGLSASQRTSLLQKYRTLKQMGAF